MIKIGMMIGDRYEILEKIGTGGMSDVYKAKCHKLNRLVAVKVLKQEFSENANFVSKFKVEAQAAAGLMHPNIVNVYDVGEENGVYYIVMELVEGLTLKKYIEKKARLSVKESLTIATQICLGIEAAHNNHIIHRDIKPQNVIISKEGKVKVTDFGIAKAATSNTITSNVMGSVHYTSPEQARGGFSDEKSDIYSLGISLFEMLTGRVPFNGETTVAIAIKQIQEEMPSPREYVPEIPLSVEQIVLKCTQKSPDRRYQSMGELIEDLRHSYTNPDDDFVKIISEDEFAPTRSMTREEMEELNQSVKAGRNTESITVDLPKVNPGVDEDEYDPKMEKVTTVLAIVVGVIILIVAVLLISKTIANIKISSSVSNSSSIEKSETVEMPNVIGKSYDEAKAILEKKKLVVRVKYEENDEYAEGQVISASIHDGLKVETGTEIELTVSAGSLTVPVPNVVGLALSAANKQIMDLDFKVSIEEDYSDTVEIGYVISQSPQGESKAPVNSTITIIVSKGVEAETTTVPDVVGLTEDAALEALLANDLSLASKSYVFSDIYAKGLVCRQSKDAKTNVLKGTGIELEVSMGKESEATGKYKFSGTILAPTISEDPDYASGSLVTIEIVTEDGVVLSSFTTTSFPVNPPVIKNIECPTGHILLTYEVSIGGGSTYDPETGESVVEPGEKEKRTIKRDIEFALGE